MEAKNKKKKDHFILNYIREAIAIWVMQGRGAYPRGLKERIQKRFGLSEKSANYWLHEASKSTRRRRNRLKQSLKVKRMAEITGIPEGEIIDKVLRGKMKLEKRDAAVYLTGASDGIKSCAVDNPALRELVDKFNSAALRSKDFWELLPPSARKTSKNRE